MVAPGSLFEAGSQAAAGGAASARAIGEQKVEREKMGTQAALQTQGEIGQTISQESSQKATADLAQQQQQAAMALEEMKLRGVHITPQLALGMFNINKDDPAFLHLTDQYMDPHAFAGFIGGEYKKAEMKLKAPKTFRLRVGRKT